MLRCSADRNAAQSLNSVSSAGIFHDAERLAAAAPNWCGGPSPSAQSFIQTTADASQKGAACARTLMVRVEEVVATTQPL